MAIIHKIGREQMQIICLEQMVEKKSSARVIDQFVDSLDLVKLGFNQIDNKVGRPAYPIDVLIKLLIYGYTNNLRSSRKLHKACQYNIEVQWLITGLKPTHQKSI